MSDLERLAREYLAACDAAVDAAENGMPQDQMTVLLREHADAKRRLEEVLPKRRSIIVGETVVTHVDGYHPGIYTTKAIEVISK